MPAICFATSGLRTIRPYSLEALLLSPETRGDIGELLSRHPFVKPLVGGAVFQASQMLDVRPNLDVVEIALTDLARNNRLPTIPSHLILRMLAMQILRQLIHVLRLGVTAHETNTGDVVPILFDKRIEHHGGKRFTDVPPQIFRMTSRTMAGTIGNIDREGHLVGNLLKNNTGIDVFQHNRTTNKRERDKGQQIRHGSSSADLSPLSLSHYI